MLQTLFCLIWASCPVWGGLTGTGSFIKHFVCLVAPPAGNVVVVSDWGRGASSHPGSVVHLIKRGLGCWDSPPQREGICARLLAQLAQPGHPGTPCSACTTQHRSFLPKVNVSGLGWLIFFFFFGLSLFPASFFKVPAIPWKDNPKSRRGGKPIQHIINGRSRSGQALGQSPSLAPHSKVQARLSNDLTAISDPDTAPALFPTHWFLVAEVWPKRGCNWHSGELQSAENVIVSWTNPIIFSSHSHLNFKSKHFLSASQKYIKYITQKYC